jgi:hypothetical protein
VLFSAAHTGCDRSWFGGASGLGAGELDLHLLAGVLLDQRQQALAVDQLDAGVALLIL